MREHRWGFAMCSSRQRAAEDFGFKSKGIERSLMDRRRSRRTARRSVPVPVVVLVGGARVGRAGL